ncbi:MAG: nucleoside triphosphate pyrophosphohydrolase [Gemmatimonas sp.]|nr:nucleoside triphosphate pyrophosphohydrolase [Gemmatimonas sp.]
MKDPQADPKPSSGATSGTLDRALGLVEFLRAHCPWDAAQTHHSLRRYLLEESHEVVDAIDVRDDDSLRDELGDLLLNVAFQVVLAEERSAFDREEVVAALEAKMRRRHPHLYGGDPVRWEASKALERGSVGGAGQQGILASLLPGTDPLAFARRLQSRVAEVGFDWPDAASAWEKVGEEMREVADEISAGDPIRLELEIGDLLFAVVNAARLAGVDPSTALARANTKFKRRFRRLEELAAARGVVLGPTPLETLDDLWDEVKGEEG